MSPDTLSNDELLISPFVSCVTTSSVTLHPSTSSKKNEAAFFLMWGFVIGATVFAYFLGVFMSVFVSGSNILMIALKQKKKKKSTTWKINNLCRAEHSEA